MEPKGIGYLIKVINDKLKVKADADLKSQNLTLSQSRVLAFLDSQGGQATQKEIEDFLEVSHPTVVGIVSRMEQNGFLISWFDPDNRRNKIVQLTENARSIGAWMSSTISKQEQAMVQGMSPEQVLQLEKLLMTIYNNLD
ncbi:MAG: MarR family winged helix-turn-helix transcriptional regulator [Lachnospiraceae bacterium]